MVVNQSQFHFMNRLNKNYVIWSCYTQNKQSVSIKWIIIIEAFLIVLLHWLWKSVYSHWVPISNTKQYPMAMGYTLHYLKTMILIWIVRFKMTVKRYQMLSNTILIFGILFLTYHCRYFSSFMHEHLCRYKSIFSR